MQRIYEGIVYDIVPKAGGVVFFCRETEDAPLFVKMLSLEDGKMVNVNLAVYAGCKMGNNYHAAVKYCNNYVLDFVVPLSSGRVFICTEEGQGHLLDSAGALCWSGEIKYRENAPSGIAFYKNALWASFKDADVLLRFNLNTMRSELRIGGKSSPFEGPEAIYIEGDTATVCGERSKNLVKVNLENYTIEDYYQFEEPVHKYLKVDGYEFVVLDSGLYVI